MFDVLITGGTVIDGTGAPPFRADVAVNRDRIAAIGSLDGRTEARRVIDAAGKVVAPGFIDMHTHSDLTLRADARGWSKLRQGVTTDVTGNCGMTPYPVAPDPERARVLKESLFAIADDMAWGWHDVQGYRDVLNAQGIAINVAPLVGHSAIRGAAIGFGEDPASPDGIAAMSRLLSDALDQGAFGLSTGLTLPPSSYGDTEEVVAIARTLAARPGRLYCSHVRGDTVDGPTGMREALEIGRRAGVPVHLAHMAVNDPRRWGTAGEVMAEIDEAAHDGVDVTCDVYPYAASSSGFSQCLPGWVQSGGRLETVARLRDPGTRARVRADMEANGLLAGWPWHWDRLMVCRVVTPEWRHAEGMTFAELGDARGVAPVDAALDLMVLALEAGQNLDSAIAQAARGLRLTHPELASDFTQLHLELRANASREEALKKLEEEAKKPNSQRRPPEFGSDKDFPLQQTLNQLKGAPVLVSKTQTERPEVKKEN